MFSKTVLKGLAKSWSQLNATTSLRYKLKCMTKIIFANSEYIWKVLKLQYLNTSIAERIKIFGKIKSTG